MCSTVVAFSHFSISPLVSCFRVARRRVSELPGSEFVVVWSTNEHRASKNTALFHQSPCRQLAPDCVWVEGTLGGGSPVGILACKKGRCDPVAVSDQVGEPFTLPFYRQNSYGPRRNLTEVRCSFLRDFLPPYPPKTRSSKRAQKSA